MCSVERSHTIPTCNHLPDACDKRSSVYQCGSWEIVAQTAWIMSREARIISDTASLPAAIHPRPINPTGPSIHHWEFDPREWVQHRQHWPTHPGPRARSNRERSTLTRLVVDGKSRQRGPEGGGCSSYVLTEPSDGNGRDERLLKYVIHWGSTGMEYRVVPRLRGSVPHVCHVGSGQARCPRGLNPEIGR